MQSVTILIVLIFAASALAALKTDNHKLRLDNKLEGDVQIEAASDYELNGQLYKRKTVRFGLSRYEVLDIPDKATNIRLTVYLFTKSGDKIKELQQSVEWPMNEESLLVKRLWKRFMISGTGSEPKLELVETIEF